MPSCTSRAKKCKKGQINVEVFILSISKWINQKALDGSLNFGHPWFCPSSRIRDSRHSADRPDFGLRSVTVIGIWMTYWARTPSLTAFDGPRSGPPRTWHHDAKGVGRSRSCPP